MSCYLGWQDSIMIVTSWSGGEAIMTRLPISLAFVLSAVAGVLLGALVMQPSMAHGQTIQAEQQTGGQSSRVYRRGEVPAETKQQRRRDTQSTQAPVDCHRDVRTHRIDGVMVTHRHVGPNCEVRIVRRSSEPR
jgi:hypothetical protein